MNELLGWANPNTPVSKRFDDIYFAKESGLKESRYAFVDQSQIECLSMENEWIHFAELGFGTGLNFCLTVERFLNQKNRRAQRLYYSAIDAYPLSQSQLNDCLSHWPELSAYRKELIDKYEDFPPSYYRLELFDSKVILDFYICDVRQALKNITSPVDTWYLDGFSPKKNPEMWSTETLDWLTAHSHPETRICTYASTSDVRKRLQSLGFSVTKIRGYGKRRESMWAVFPGEAKKRRHPQNSSIRILGAGIAGMSLAHQFAKKSIDVEIFDQHDRPGQEASGNVRALVKPNLETFFNSRTQFSLSSFFFARNIYKQFSWEETGSVFLAHAAKAKRIRSVKNYLSTWSDSIAESLSPEQTRKELGMDVFEESVFLKKAGSVCPSEFFRKLLDDQNLSIRFIQKEIREPDLKPGDYICLSGGSKKLSAFENFKIRLKRGQVTEMLKDSVPLQRILNYGGYLLPFKDRLLLGSTYDASSEEAILKESDNLQMYQQLQQTLLAPLSKMPRFSNSRASVRASLRDALPLVGSFGEIHLNIAYASRAFTYAPWCGEFLACQHLGEPLPPSKGFHQLISSKRRT